MMYSRNPVPCPCHIRESQKKKKGWLLSKAKKQLGSTCLKCWEACITNNYQNGVNMRIVFPLHHGCKSPCDTWIHTSILKQLCYLVLGGSRNTVEMAQLGQSLHEVSVLSIQGSYSDSCHCKVLQKTQSNQWNPLKKKKTFHCIVSRWYKKSHSLAFTQSSAQYVPWTFPTLHVSSVGRANWNKTTSLAVKWLSSATVVLIKGLIE